jgi:hypothetical protein
VTELDRRRARGAGQERRTGDRVWRLDRDERLDHGPLVHPSPIDKGVESLRPEAPSNREVVDDALEGELVRRVVDEPEGG